MITKIIIPIILLICVFDNSKAQSGIVINEETKVLIFGGVVADYEVKCLCALDKWIGMLKNHYNFFDITSSDTIVFHLPDDETYRGEYSLQLFKIPELIGKSRYVLKFNDKDNTAYLRIKGFRENDLKLLFDYLRTKGVNKNKLIDVVNQWSNADTLFKETDLECLLNGYLKRRTSDSCYLSLTYKEHNILCYNCDVIKPDELNAIFSRVPLYGYLRNREDRK